ncbi:bile acid:sodium symporter family protein [Devosia yakushimensis]|uniref:bile acid:sodium symporter family protein n=1 Tax=Devosia yakushimensis TaxID=470028 RepID=UPI0024E0C2BD|nr:bile acid:sodium symporter family protein [Devosia yakushimensis]
MKTEVVLAGFTNWRLQLGIPSVTYIIFPLICILLANFAEMFLSKELVLGLLYIGILPSTVQSSIAFTALAQGNVAASVCAASISNLLGVFVTPILASFILHTNDGSFNSAAVVNIALQIVTPFLLGQVARRWIGDWIGRHRLLSLAVDRGSILLIVYTAFSAGVVAGVWNNLDSTQLLVLIAVVSLVLAIAMGVTIAVGRLSGFNSEDNKSMIFCGSTKSLASGVPIANILFAGGPVSLIILPLMLYHQLQILICSMLAQSMAARALENGSHLQAPSARPGPVG